MFSSFLRNKKKYWNTEVYNVYEDFFPENLNDYNDSVFIMSDKKLKVLENIFFI